MAKKGNFYSITSTMLADKPVVELRIYDDIGFWGKTAADFVEELDAAAAKASMIIVAINSGGGSVFDAFAMYNALRRYSGRIELKGRVDGVAASAATLPLIACDTIEMPENSQIMIHEPTTWAWGTLAELKSSIAMMENIIDSVIAAYVRRSGQSAEKIMAMMEATTWLAALEAQSMGFCDVITEEVALEMSANSIELLSRFPNLPAPLQQLVSADSTATETSAAPSTPAVTTAATPAKPEVSTEAAPATAKAETPVASVPPATQADAPAAAASSAPADAGAVVAHVYATCRSNGVPHLAESILCSGGLASMDAANARIEQAKEIASLCLAAKLQDKTADFVSAGLSVEQVRARLFDSITADAVSNISNLQRPEERQPSQSGSMSSSVYAARAAWRRRS